MQHIPRLLFKIDDLFSLFWLPVDGSMVKPHNRLQLDSDLFSALMWTMPKPEASGGNQAT